MYVHAYTVCVYSLFFFANIQYVHTTHSRWGYAIYVVGVIKCYTKTNLTYLNQKKVKGKLKLMKYLN